MEYAFCCKLDRLSGGGILGARAYDLNDAIDYLARYLAGERKTQVALQTVQLWFSQYSLQWTAVTDVVIGKIVQGYASRFGPGQTAIF
jgi:hypothetical protein